MTAQSDAERAAAYRRRRGIQPRTLSDTPLARARRKMRKGARIADLDPAEAEALRIYQTERKRAQRTNP